MPKDRILPFHVAPDTSAGTTGFAGLCAYLELACALGLPEAVDQHVGVAGEQGWLDRHQVLTALLINLSGGDCMDDVERLEQDAGLAAVMRQAEGYGLSNHQRKQLGRRFRKGRQRTFPSPSRLREWLEAFHDPDQEALREPGRAFIPAPNAALVGLAQVNQALVAAVAQAAPQTVATLDVDATLTATGKREALYCYKGYQAYQPLNVWWAETGLVVVSEFRDGNVPAGYELERLLAEAVGQLRTLGVETVYFRSDSAAYQHAVMRYCRREQIGFSLSADLSAALKAAVREVPEEDWQRLGQGRQEWAEVVFVPDGAGFSLKEEPFRYVAVREPLEQDLLPGLAEQLELPFATGVCSNQRVYKLTAIVTNRELPGRELIRWHRERCGKSEEVHAVMKEDLAGGQLPSGKFGANAAWWQLMVLAYNLQAAMGRVVLGGPWATKRMKAMRFHLIALPGRLVTRGRQLLVKLSGPAAEWLAAIRQRIWGLARAPAG
jgi:hypothetical protein